MNKLFLLIFSFTTIFTFSQTSVITEKIAQAIEADNPVVLFDELKTQKFEINDCFELKEKPYSLFAIAIKMNKQKIFSELINQKANLNKICEDKTPLMYAVKYGNITMVKHLVEAGAEVNAKNNEGKNAFDYAQKYGQKEIEEYLHEKIDKTNTKPMISTEPPIVNLSSKYVIQINNDNGDLKVINTKLKEKGNIIELKNEDGKFLFNVKLKESITKNPSIYNYSSGKIFVVSDVEGNFPFFEKLLKSNKIIDDKFNWTFGNNHLVLLGDFFDRGTQVFESLWLIYKLEAEAEKQGGKVHFILGNHDIMNLEEDFRYVQEKFFANSKHLNLDYKEWVSENSEIGKWLRSKNTIEKIGNYLFVHAGISPKVINTELSINDINKIISENINIKPTTEELKLLKNQESPYWYRGYFMKHDGYELIRQDEIDNICDYFKVDKLIVGHTPVEEIKTYYNNKIIGVDVLRKKKLGNNPPSALLINDNKFLAIDEIGNQILIK